MKIYLACPYSHPSKAVRNDRFRAANKKAAELMKEGHIVFSPLSHSCPVADFLDNHLDHNFWLKQDFAFLAWCDEMWILDIDNGAWEESKGVLLEKDHAELLGIPVRVINESKHALWPDRL